MTRIFLPLLLFLIPFTSYGQYQLPNPGFENWESNGEPTGFHSFNTATGSLSNFAGNSNQLSQQSDVRPGSSGSSSAKISARNILGNNANGNLTTGQIVAGSMTASSTDNHNKSYPSNTGYNQPFTGKPDAITIWTKYVPGNSGDYARVNAVIHGNSNYQDPENTDYSNIKYAQATLNYQAASGNGWQQLNIPFNVINNNVKPAYILISFSTNKSAGGGSSNDAVYIDDIEFIYNSRLTSLKVGGSDLSGFDKNTYNYTYRVNSLNSLPAITATPDGLGASVSQNITDGTATITVKGNDYSANPANTHTYTVTFMAETNISASDVITAYGTTKDIPVTTNNDQSSIEYTVADPGIAKIENGKIVPLKAGSTTLTLSQKASKNYTAASKTIKITVNKAQLTVTADNATRPYGSANPTFTLSYTGFVNGETEAALAVKPTATCSATSTSPAGTYDITAAGGKSDNYSFSYKKGTLTITSSSVQISISPIGEKKYGDAAFDLQATSPNQETPITYTVADPTVARIDNGRVTILKAGSTTITARQAASANYGEASASTPLVIKKASLTASVNNATRRYGEENPAFSFSYKGFVNGETEAVLAVKPSASCNATAKSIVGTYDIVTTGNGSDENYDISCTSGTLTIEKALLTATVEQTTRRYGEENPTFALIYKGFANNETESVLTSLPSATCNASPVSPAGKYDITVNGGNDENYEIECINSSLVIEKAVLTVTADNATRRYGEGNPVFSFSYKGFVNGETEAVLAVKPTATCEATPVSQAGKYDISISGGNDENYDFIYIKGILTVEVSSVELTFSDFGEKSYGDAPFTLQVSSPNTETPIVFSIEDGSIARIDNGVVTLLKAGSTTITARQEASVNYGEASATIRLIVKKAPLTIRAENKKRKYGEENPVFTLSYDGLVGKDTENDIPTPGITCEATATAKPGSYPITPASITDERYEISTVVGELTIEKAVLEVTCRNESSIAGNEPVTDFEFYISGFVNGESQSVIDRLPVITCEVTSSSTVGFYPLVISGGEDDCYTFNYTNGTYTVRSATLSQTSITLSPISGKRYGDQPFAPIYSTNNSETEMQFAIGNPEIVAYKNGQLHILKSGTTTLKAYQESGFNFTEGESDEIILTIEKAPLRVNVKDTVRIEGVNNPVFSLTYSGFINGDDASVIDLEPTATCTADISSPGGYYDISVSGGEDDCYEFTQYIGGTLLVKGKTRISIDEISGKRYGDLPFAPVCSTNNDESPVRFEIADTEVARIENGKIVILKGGTTTLKAYQEESALFSDGESEEISFTVEKALLSVSADNAVRIEGEDNPTFSLSVSGFINGEDISCIDQMPTATCTADISSPGGYYDISVSGGEDDCYEFTQYIGGTLLVKGKTRISIDEISGKRYGDLPFAPVCSTNNDESPVRFEIADTEVARIENGKIVILKGGTTTLKAYQEESALFSDGESEESSFTVEKAPLSVSADNVLRQVGEPNPAFTVSYSGFVNGDDASVIDVVPVAQCLSASISSPAGYYDITVSGGEDDCYTFTRYTSGTLVVTEVSALNAPTLDGVRIYLSDKRLTVKGLQADTIEIYALNGRLAGRYKPGEIVTLPSGFYIAKTETGKACLQITE